MAANIGQYGLPGGTVKPLSREPRVVPESLLIDADMPIIAVTNGGFTGGVSIDSTNPAFFGIVVPMRCGVDQVRAEVRFGVASETFRVGIWRQDIKTGEASTLLFDTGAIATDAAGVKTTAIAPPFIAEEGEVLWVGLNTSATVSFEGYGSGTKPTTQTGNGNTASVEVQGLTYAPFFNYPMKLHGLFGNNKIPNIRLRMIKP